MGMISKKGKMRLYTKVLFTLALLFFLRSPPLTATSASSFFTLCNSKDLQEEQKRTVLALLKAAKTQDCGKAEGLLSKANTLKLNNQGLSDLSPFMFFTHIVSLDLSKNYIRDLSPLAHLKSLRSLNLSSNHLTTIAPLAKLSKLQSLNLGSNNIALILALEELTHLQALNISNNQIASLAAIKKLRRLQKLDCQKNALKSLNPLASLLDLEYLDASHNGIASVKALSFLTRLQTLSLHHNALTSAEGLTKLKALTYVDLSFNPLTETKHSKALNLADTSPKPDAAQQKSTLDFQKLMWAQIKGPLFLGGVLHLILLSCLWMIFAKTGQTPWYALLPVYNIYLLTRIIRKPRWWVLVWLSPFIACLPAVFVRHAPYLVGGLSTAAALAQTCVYILSLRAIARLYGCTRAVTLGVIVLPFFFLPFVSYFGKPQARHGRPQARRPSSPGR